jgi:hypothetical protein
VRYFSTGGSENQTIEFARDEDYHYQMLSYGIVVNNNIIAQVMETNYLHVSLSSWVKLTEDVMHLAKIARKVSG